MPLKHLSQLDVGKIDGKYEYIETSSDSVRFFDSFLIPQSINTSEFLSGEKYIVRGFRGTGKTSLLRWLAKKLRDEGAKGQFVLFKSGLSESQRMEISRQIGIKWEDVDSAKIEMAQDFKEAWRWFLHRKIAEVLAENEGTHQTNAESKRYLKLLGVTDKPWFERVIGEFPRVESARIKVRGALEFIEAEFEGEICGGPGRSVSISAVLRKLDALLARFPIKSTLYIYLDELEVFYHTDEQYKRDLRMVRDLIFAVDQFVSVVRGQRLPIRLCAGVRSEVLDALGSKGQEVSRIAQDCGANIAWHFARRGLDHPLFHMIRRKIWASETRHNIDLTPDPISYYFPTAVDGVPLDVFMLDQSFYKPRDIVWRLSIAKEQFPYSTVFDPVVLGKTDILYSAKLWEEVLYELSASYTSDEVSLIESLFLGQDVFFSLEDIAERLRSKCMSRVADGLMRRRGARLVLADLYRLGAIGNIYKAGRDWRSRWMFRGDATLMDNARMELHPALVKRLCARRRARSAPFAA